MMRILVAGRPGSGQREVVKALIGKEPTLGSMEGASIEHTFQTKYFSQECGIWTDEYTSDTADQWVTEFSSQEAAEVRSVLALFVYTFEDAIDPEIEMFLKKLKSEGWTGLAVAVPKRGTEHMGQVDTDSLEDYGFELLAVHEVYDAALSAIIDFGDELGGPESNPAVHTNDEILEPLVQGPEGDVDLDAIMERLKLARDSNMTPEEKKALADTLAAQLIP